MTQVLNPPSKRKFDLSVGDIVKIKGESTIYRRYEVRDISTHIFRAMPIGGCNMESFDKMAYRYGKIEKVVQ